MKRSDALRIIWEAINELEDGNFILTKLEESGMKPQPYLKKFLCQEKDTRKDGTNGNRYCCSDHFYYPEQEGMMAEGWEPEDE